MRFYVDNRVNLRHALQVILVLFVFFFREHAPSIIFMDEIDSIGSSRLEGGSGGKAIDGVWKLTLKRNPAQSQHAYWPGPTFSHFIGFMNIHHFHCSSILMRKRIYRFLEIYFNKMEEYVVIMCFWLRNYALALLCFVSYPLQKYL